MKIEKQKLKTMVLSLGLAAMLLPANLNAQINHGLLQNPYKSQDDLPRGAMGRGPKDSGNGLSLQDFGENQDGLTLQNFGETAPLGSGWLFLMGVGLGYAAMKQRKNIKKQTK